MLGSRGNSFLLLFLLVSFAEGREGLLRTLKGTKATKAPKGTKAPKTKCPKASIKGSKAPKGSKGSGCGAGLEPTASPGVTSSPTASTRSRWVLGAESQSCNTVCAGEDFGCLGQAQAAIDTEAKALFVYSNFLGGSASINIAGEFFGVTPARFIANCDTSFTFSCPSIPTDTVIWDANAPVSCDISVGGARLFCCCATNLADCPTS